jgi:signal transduction histidine kinase
MRRATGGHVIRDFATRYIHKNGSVVMLSWSGVWSEPEQRHFFIGRDVTEQKRVDRMKDEFVATVSHELRTPVTTIAGPLNILASGAAGELPASIQRLITIADRNSKRLTRLIEDMLDVDNIERGRMKCEFNRENARYLVECAIKANRQLAAQFRVSVRLDTDAEDAFVYTDSDRFLQVIENLLSNAVKFSPTGEEVVVSIESLDSHVRVSIHDRGPGIPEEYKDLIFEKFVQVVATDARAKGGTGLGLSIVRQTMSRLGGSVGHSPAPLGGTIFHIEVPREPELQSDGVIDFVSPMFDVR